MKASPCFVKKSLTICYCCLLDIKLGFAIAYVSASSGVINSAKVDTILAFLDSLKE
ncbi:hypothetical protein [Gilliamella sp. Choc6-1]|jgi:heptaprenylglyceryl phosphate synthase|uniref:hypothetical protein n=1 Tax=Gilliamella sp. Choc6-1 TaxID=3120239 RepID=UPI00159EC6EC|nr:hypothetical protein [Gilliamella apicola]